MLVASYKFRIGNRLDKSKGFDEVQKKKWRTSLGVAATLIFNGVILVGKEDLRFAFLNADGVVC